MFGTINTRSGLLIVYGLVCDGGLPNPTGPLPVLHHRPPCAQTVKSKLSSIWNPHDMHIHNSLSKVAIYMPCINIHAAWRDHLEMVFAHERLTPITMGNTLHGSDSILFVSVAK